MTTQAERIAMMEVEVRELKEQVKAMDQKLDDLLALRYKGAGAFWLMSALLGTSIVGAFTQLLEWFRS